MEGQMMNLDLYVPETSNFDLGVGSYIPTHNQYYIDIKFLFNNGYHFDNANNFVSNIAQINKNTVRGTFQKSWKQH